MPFDASHVYASGNLAADMMANATAEATGRALAVRLYHMTNDPGMRDMLAFLIARDNMHQQQWLAAIEDMGGLSAALPIPNSFPLDQENQEYSHVFLGFDRDGSEPPQGRWSEGETLDGRGEFTSRPMEPQGEEPSLAATRPERAPQNEQL